ncbi:SANT/Myb-like DNA-binding domain-containing protein [Metabacillus sp. YM-086]|uniref:SANT/Myb-like DNA-binding domain-containing protein n=1 Tax=Metabacillus sp. YM-086 TaxID=3341729 RepID=UPI003A87D5DA
MSITSDQNIQSNHKDNKRTYRHWTTLEDRKLLELRKSGMKFRHIAEELSRTPISVEKRYRKILKGDT